MCAQGGTAKTQAAQALLDELRSTSTSSSTSTSTATSSDLPALIGALDALTTAYIFLANLNVKVPWTIHYSSSTHAENTHA
jgi:hypothetical protein